MLCSQCQEPLAFTKHNMKRRQAHLKALRAITLKNTEPIEYSASNMEVLNETGVYFILKHCYGKQIMVFRQWLHVVFVPCRVCIVRKKSHKNMP